MTEIYFQKWGGRKFVMPAQPTFSALVYLANNNLNLKSLNKQL